MDKRNTFIGVLLIAAAIVSYMIGMKNAVERPTPAAIRQSVAQQESAPAPAPAPAAPSLNGPLPQADFVAAAEDDKGATVITLQNDFVKVRLTDFGGAVLDVALKKYAAALGQPDPYIFNELHADPMLAFVGFPGLDRSTKFQLVSKTDTEVIFRTVLDGRLEVTRRYILSPDKVDTTDPYEIRNETTFRNLTDQTLPPLRVMLALGTAAPLNAADNGRMLTTGYSTGHAQTFLSRSQFEASGGLLGMGAHDAKPLIEEPGPVVWASVTNQFFAGIFTPEAPEPLTDPATKAPVMDPATGKQRIEWQPYPGGSLIARRVKLLAKLPDTDSRAYGVTSDVPFDLPAIAPRGERKIGGELYVGPKDYPRLSNSDVFKADQDKVMQFGFWKFFSQILLTLMTWIHSFVPNWGLAIIFTTLLLKIVFMPLTLAAARSGKRMQKLQPELKALKEKFKDSPQKQQAATMALFKQHKVNPMGGCLPMLVTLPFFIGFYSMLYSTAELRFAPFLWAHDLSAQDTVGHVWGFAINVFPLLFTATSFLQMQLVPQPTVDSAQARMMKFSPLFVLFIYYNYSCALSLYSTTNAFFAIGQQLVINRMKDPVLAPAAGALAGGAPAPGGKRVKNVTPRKGK